MFGTDAANSVVRAVLRIQAKHSSSQQKDGAGATPRTIREELGGVMCQACAVQVFFNQAHFNRICTPVIPVPWANTSSPYALAINQRHGQWQVGPHLRTVPHGQRWISSFCCDLGRLRVSGESPLAGRPWSWRTGGQRANPVATWPLDSRGAAHTPAPWPAVGIE